MNKKPLAIPAFLLLCIGWMLAACSPATPSPAPAATPCPTALPCPACPAPVVAEVPYQQAWAESGHNDQAAPAFRRWDTAQPAEIPVTCARCHTSQGFQDFLGADGSAKGVVDAAVPASQVSGIACAACHNSPAAALTSVKFPYTVVGAGGNLLQKEIGVLGGEAVCLHCHQGRTAMSHVEDLIKQFGVQDEDAVVAPVTDAQGKPLSFSLVNIHYGAAAAAQYGTQAKGGFEYPGKLYDARYEHTAGHDTCTGCHDAHSLEPKYADCALCHGAQAGTLQGLRAIRQVSSTQDYDGDGDMSEGMSGEVLGMQERLLEAIQEYAVSVADKGIVYDAETYPYFLSDLNGDGAADQDDSGAPLVYDAFTARLMKAAYNYHFSRLDPGAYVHGGKYMVQLLYDSIEDINLRLGTLDMTAMHRQDAGHFAGNTEAFRHWDEMGGVVPSECSRCHTAEGLPQYLENDFTIGIPASSGFACTTCHTGTETHERHVIRGVTFPSGKTATFSVLDFEGKPLSNDANLCLVCHQGSSSKSTLDAAILLANPADEDSEAQEGKRLSFTSFHYSGAGAVLFGSQVQGAYEYPDRQYAGAHPHVMEGITCSTCHEVHALTAKTGLCAGCHIGDQAPADIRLPDDTRDYDGDSNATEGMLGEIQTLSTALLDEMEDYAVISLGDTLSYNPTIPPYFFGSDGKGFSRWSPRLLKAAYNYQFVQNDPGVYAHNHTYAIQILIDSIEDLGGSIDRYNRP